MSELRKDAPLEAFTEFARRMLRSLDVDPVYPVLRTLHSILPTERRRLWSTLLYVAFYHLPAAHRAFRWHPSPTPAILEDDVTLSGPFGTERRGLRVVANARAHVASILEHLDELEAVEFGFDELENRARVAEVVRSIRFNGRWATYKTTEILSAVHGWPLAAESADHAGSTGPRAGLALLYAGLPEGNRPEAIAELDRVTEALLGRLYFDGVVVLVEELETLLCDFRSMAHGRYYVGHDTDLMLEQTLRAADLDRSAILDARARSLPAG